MATHTIVYCGRYQLNFERLKKKPTDFKYLKPDGSFGEVAPAADIVDGLIFGNMQVVEPEGTERPFVAVKVNNVVLDKPLQIVTEIHTDSNGLGPTAAQFGDEFARRFLADIILLNPRQTELLALYKNQFGELPQILFDSFELNIGTIYRRLDLHLIFGGQRQGGISTPAAQPILLLFTGEQGHQYGYRDGFQDDGIFWYTGEGQIGDMKMIKGNSAIRNSKSNGKKILLFEYIRKAYVHYIGEAHYVGHHIAVAPDRKGRDRRVIVFELALTNESLDAASSDEIESLAGRKGSLWNRSMEDLRELAMATTSPEATTQERRVNSRVRSDAVRVYVLRRAGGVCEGCKNPAPFKRKNGSPYLEPHHIHRLADGGPDHPAHVASLCPNCHRRVHHGNDGQEYNSRILDYVQEIEAARN